MTERGRFESVQDSSNYSATSEAAVQAWDKTQFRGQVCSRGDTDVMCVDFDNGDIYNRNAGNANLRDSSQSLQTAENSIESVLKRLESGNFRGISGMIRQLDTSADTLERGADKLTDGIRNLAANSDVEDLIDLADARKDTITAGYYVENAVKMLERGSTRQAARYLRESLDEIDEAQSGIKNGTGNDLRQVARAGDQVARLIDPISGLPLPNELNRPGKFLERIINKNPYGGLFR